jgi:hypothetical protein
VPVTREVWRAEPNAGLGTEIDELRRVVLPAKGFSRFLVLARPRHNVADVPLSSGSETSTHQGMAAARKVAIRLEYVRG